MAAATTPAMATEVALGSLPGYLEADGAATVQCLCRECLEKQFDSPPEEDDPV